MNCIPPMMLSPAYHMQAPDLPLQERIMHPHFQAEIAKKFFRFVPEQHQRRGIITPIDESFSPVFLNDFVVHCLGRSRNDIALISQIVNPVKTLMQKTKSRSGRFFFTIFPFMEYGPDGWAEGLKRMFQGSRFELQFMYGACDGHAVRVVFGVSHKTNPKVLPRGLAVLIQKTFTKGDRRGFIPMLSLDETGTFLTAIAHVGRYRVTTDPRKDAFNLYDPCVGDVGDALAETVVEWVRFTSCRLMLDSLQSELEDPVQREQVRSYNLKICEIHGIPFEYDMESLKVWNSKDKLANSVSVIFQSKADPKKQSNEQAGSMDRLLHMLANLESMYKGVSVKCNIERAADNSAAIIHVLLLFPQKVHLYGCDHLSKQLQQLTLQVGCCSMLSLMPVDFRSDNMLALGVLAMFDGKSSFNRDHFWLNLCKSNWQPELKACSSLPEPVVVKVERGRSLTPAPAEAAARGRSRTPAGRGRSMTPAPRARSKTPVKSMGRSRTPSPSSSVATERYGLSSAAGGRLLSEVIESFWKADFMQDYAPGTREFRALFDEVPFAMPEWIGNVLDYNRDPLFQIYNDMSATVYGSSVIRCLKIVAKAMCVSGKLLYEASCDVVAILRDQQDTLETLSHSLLQSMQACQGVIPVLEAFRHMKKTTSSVSLTHIGAKPEKEDGDSSASAPYQTTFMPLVIRRMSDSNPIKQIYRHMHMANVRLEEMGPDDNVYICWDRMARKAWELSEYLLDAHRHARILLEHCRA